MVAFVVSVVMHLPGQVLGLVLAASAAAGQGPTSRPGLAAPSADVAVIRAQLAAAEPKVIAWGGHNAATAARGELLPDVQAAFARLGGIEEHARWLCENALLDACIRLDARMDPAKLRACWQRGHRDAALVLAARDAARAVPFLLQVIADDAYGERGQAVCNLLLAAAPKQLVQAVAARLEVKVRLQVDDGETWFEVPAGDATACGLLPDGFPPLVTHMLVTEPDPGDALLAPGPVPVHVRRWTRAGGGCNPFSADEAAYVAAGNDYRLECLAHLLGVQLDDLGLRGRIEARHTWQDVASFHEAVGVALGDARAAWRRMFTRLVERRLLALADAPAPRVTVVVEDLRTDPDEPLPAPRDGKR